ncbi:MAG: hypothetical protein LBT30_07535 [Clostridiales bacterium]|jgi:hypothetical protein|nr:hypothetical protein [Clostridiales bacterium]
MIDNLKRCILIFAVAVLCLGFFIPVASLFPSFAVDVDYHAFDFTDVLADLQSSSTLDGRAFDVSDYPYSNSEKRPYLLNVVEYAYSYKTSLQGNYGLYLYIYNPQGIEFSEAVAFNEVEIATAYKDKYTATDWETFSLLFCSKSQGVYANLFYKFRVLDRIGADGKTILQRVNSIERVYDISGVEFAAKGAANAVDYNIGSSYRFTGYSQGYGVSVYDESTLSCTSSTFETISLDVYDTYYRTNTSGMGRGYQNQLNTVYFAVDDYFFDSYGALAKIKAEWYEYVTNPIFVTSSDYLYKKLLPYLGQYFPEGYRSYIPIPELTDSGFIDSIYDWLFDLGIVHDDIYDSGALQDFFLSWLLMFGEEKDLEKYILAYSLSFGSGNFLDKFDNISADLFADVVWDYRTRGYNCVDLGDKNFDMLAYDKSDNWLYSVVSYGLFNTLGWFGHDYNFGEDYVGIVPIYEVQEFDMFGSVSENLLISSDDVFDFTAFYDYSKSQGKRVILFRYAVTPYFACDVDWISDVQGEQSIRNQSYLAVESVFLDFDILQLTFSRDGVYMVIPVVQSPIDIFPGLTPPLQPIINPFWLDWLPLIVVLFVVILGGVVVLFVLK